MPTARFPKGTILSRGDSTSGTITYSAVGELTDVQLPGYTVEEIDVTNHGSSDNFREVIAGLVDGGSINAEINFDHLDTVHTNLQDSATGRTKVNWKIDLPLVSGSTKATVVWEGFVTSFGPISAPINDKYTASITVRVASKPVFTAEA